MGPAMKKERKDNKQAERDTRSDAQRTNNDTEDNIRQTNDTGQADSDKKEERPKPS